MLMKVIFPLLLLKLCSYVFCYRDEEFEENLANLKNDGVTPEEIMAWWENYKGERPFIRNGTRVFPLCLGRTRNGDYPPNLQRWAAILDDIALKDERSYDRAKHLYSTDPKTNIKEITMRHISVRANTGQWVLYQWLHFHLVVKQSVKGVLIQPLTGPLGLPGGEFKNIACKSHPYTDSIQPCTFAPRSSQNLPNVYLYDGDPTKTLSFSFRWNEAQCHEAAFFQFIIILTNFETNDYEIKLSPLYWEQVYALGQAGMFTPAYEGFSDYTCDDIPVSISQADVRLFPNREYDECVSKGKGREQGSSVWSWTCPPGPFECSTFWDSQNDWVALRDLIISRMTRFDREENNITDCCEIEEIPTPPPPTLAPEEKKEKELEVRTVEAEIKSKVTHGGLCIFTWLVLIPLADHTARYYKDFPDFRSLGLGLWIIVHLTLHCSALVLVWCSFGLVIGTGENSFGDVSTKHFVLGSLAILIQHVGFFSAFKLSQNVKASVAFKHVLAHALGGRVAYATAFCAIILSSANNAMKGFSFLLVCINIGCFGVSMYYEHRQHDILGVNIHRARCPVLQRLVMVDDVRPPMMKQKIVVLVGMIGLLFGVYVYMEIVFRDFMR